VNFFSVVTSGRRATGRVVPQRGTTTHTDPHGPTRTHTDPHGPTAAPSGRRAAERGGVATARGMEEVGIWTAGPVDGGEDVWLADTATLGGEGDDQRRLLLRDELPAARGVDDMSELAHLHEPAMLQNLQLRCEAGRVYTWCGDVCVSVNPFTPHTSWEGADDAEAALLLPLYSRWVMERYSGRVLGELPPHIFAVADHAYRGLLLRRHSQSVVVSGESGAGKTEATKSILNYIAWASANTDPIKGNALTGDRAAASNPATSVTEVIVAANPLLEAVGNAKTLRNDNSSRFGKYIELLLDEHGGGGRGATANGSPAAAAAAAAAAEPSVLRGALIQTYHLRVIVIMIGTLD
jgi:hypothetical protein